jgi:ornithine cyclodeaminase/alanine dehydrogenase-like protein (mu-crystallin family)
MPPKPGIYTQPDAFIHAMPAYIPALRSAGIKWVGGYPENHERDLPYITGLPYAVMDCTWITAYRTGAAPALAQIDKLSTDDHAQFRYYQSVGYFQDTPDPYADLGEIVAGLKPGREREEERTLAMNLGLALDDMAVAPAIYRRAKERGIGTWLPL